MAVAGIDPAVDPELATAAAELNSWIQYLLSPNGHDGPRIYRAVGVDDSGSVPQDAEMPQRMPNLDSDPQYRTVSVIDGYAADPGALLRPAEAVAGIQQALVDATYSKLVAGCFTWRTGDHTSAGTKPDTGEPVSNVKYNERYPVRQDWAEMRDGWHGSARFAAYRYEREFIPYQVYTENCSYVIAEHLVRYRAIFQKASSDIAALMNALTKTFAQHNWYGGGGITIDIASVVVTALVAAATTVLSGGGAGLTSAVVLTEAVGEAIKTAESKQENRTTSLIEDRDYLRDSVKQYLDAVNRIEQETAEAIIGLAQSLPAAMDRIRTEREYRTGPGESGPVQRSVPQYRDFFDQ
ncbi:hypothetical protein ALI144C_23600 [Actinosynnema sp. ALI-1.44]|nr:hypothetical protein ALI144C_23600 [Actinosynnema sp. ALI-1.44]